MEMKRIDDTTIQVLINQDDLDQRWISIPDLMNNQDQIEDFFYQILDEVDLDHDFNPDEPLTFQARPLRNNGLELLISRVSRQGDQLSASIKEELRGHDRPDDPDLEDDEVSAALADPNVDQLTRVVKLARFDDLVALAAEVDTQNLTSDLYKWQGDYYLILTYLDDGTLTADELYDRLSVIFEYGQAVPTAPGIIKEHGQLVMAQTAIELTRHYFDN